VSHTGSMVGVVNADGDFDLVGFECVDFDFGSLSHFAECVYFPAATAHQWLHSMREAAQYEENVFFVWSFECFV
jgi:hypothetical protein